ncbi:hypothetical protein M4D55_20550 [Metabacillus idriensis]|uniref:hypothetical protein n=1 Tax=Metabacillus idriensis TaxID=324768 RepID=UPI0008A8868E|nr:hypothetical protein [Metabacillus idriensis]MCM3598155.1 hypothetical protein [Metabacillus idriensis]OHR63743.1 hypothetical protein HMPREF3291_03450 [Bacillus sp. HMSC76G11]
MTIPNHVFKCIQQAKCCQSFYMNCIDNNSSSEEIEMLQCLALHATKQIIRIKEFYQEKHGIDLVPYHLHK